ncbi:D-alanine--D-alanine ligase-like protein [Cladobotryum mycophilum]|uniref:D-alanine--D-alanine ligase-like protein n=1 Tax=Cladobotryum mycophilum TaxID=491253 RepID=A0ABR0SP44_9HYPO
MADIRGPPLNIALIAEQRSTYVELGYSEADCSALPHDGEIKAVFDTLKKLGHNVTLVLGIQSLVELLAAGKHEEWDLAFNMSQGFHGPAREAQVPALLEAYQVTHTFSDATTMALCQNKANTKIVLDHHGIPNSPFAVIPATEQSLNLSNYDALLPHYPLFVKPVTEGSSKGIETFNKVTEPSELALAVQKLRARFPGQDVLVESFLAGREFTVSILGTGTAGQVIGIREHIWQPSTSNISNGNGSNGFQSKPDFANRQSKSSNGGEMLKYNDVHDMDDPRIKAACHVALDAWGAFGCRDAGRVDLRFDFDDADSVPNVLEVNPIGGLLPGHSPLPACAEQNGISFDRLLAAIVESALQRKPKNVSPKVSHQHLTSQSLAT